MSGSPLKPAGYGLGYLIGKVVNRWDRRGGFAGANADFGIALHRVMAAFGRTLAVAVPIVMLRIVGGNMIWKIQHPGAGPTPEFWISVPLCAIALYIGFGSFIVFGRGLGVLEGIYLTILSALFSISTLSALYFSLLYYNDVVPLFLEPGYPGWFPLRFATANSMDVVIMISAFLVVLSYWLLKRADLKWARSPDT